VTDERLLEMLPLAALGVLDGADRAYVEARLPGDEGARQELLAFERVVARIAFAADPVLPGPDLRARLLAAAGVAGRAPAPESGAMTPESAASPARAGPRAGERGRARAGRASTLLALAAALALAAGLVVVRHERDLARREAREARLEAKTAAGEARRAIDARDAAHRRLAEEEALRVLLARPGTRVASLAGLGPAPDAHGRVVWDPASLEAVLLAGGLASAPAGRAYEAWVIAEGAPVAAGVFQADAEGRATVRLSAVEELERVRTFAVTLEPAGGTPAPTGPMVLAGAAS